MITRTKVSIAALTFAIGLTACADKRSTEASQEDLQRDLQLASATTMNLASPRVDSTLLNSMETKPTARPQPATTVRKGAGTRAVRSQAPTVKATPDVDVAALEEVAEAQTESDAPAPAPSEPVAVAPRPAPVVIPAAGDYGVGNGGIGNGGGVYGGGTGTGVVIRGGGVDGDNCDLHRGGRRGGIYTTGPVYIPATPMPRGGVFTSGGPASIGRTVIGRSRPSGSSSRPAGFTGMRRIGR